MPFDGGAMNIPTLKPVLLLLLISDTFVTLAKLRPALTPIPMLCDRANKGSIGNRKKIDFFILDF
jgi:hypothetical protein